ncbi:phiSA1p31-related protein [Streptomyces sp. NPDC047990]|uniref:phiSA1p31-related protein n=1 Tax=Streptomyces sp. NPDC047990 TaxID=3365496 RepID=UPI003722CC3A
MFGLLDGAVVDLDQVQVAVDGSWWLWTCELSDAGDPLMQRIDDDGCGQVLPLPVVSRGHGPVAALRQPTTAAMYRQVLEAA